MINEISFSYKDTSHMQFLKYGILKAKAGLGDKVNINRKVERQEKMGK